MKKLFLKFSTTTSELLGTPFAFVIALASIVIWAISGPFLGFSETWQLVINTTTTIITFLTVFLIQNTQNRNDRATQLKLDELLHAIKTARNDFIDLEDIDEDKLKKLRTEYKRIKNKGKTRKNTR